MQAIQNVLTNSMTIIQGIFTLLLAGAVVYFFAKQKKIALITTIIIGGLASVFVYGGQPAIDAIQAGLLEFIK